MNTSEQGKAGLRRKPAEAVALENDYWVWGVIFTAVALTALCVVMLFSVAIG